MLARRIWWPSMCSIMTDRMMISGFGKFHTNDADPANPTKKLTPYVPICWADVCRMVDQPQDGIEKDVAQWLIPSTLHSRKHREQEEHGTFLLLWQDLDYKDGQVKPLEEVASVLSEILGDCDFEVYTSRSATVERQKARILVPVLKELSGAEWAICQEVLADKLRAAGIEPDQAALGCGQLLYLPNRGAFYEHVSRRDGRLFDPMQAFHAEASAKRQAIARSKVEVERRNAAALEKRQALRHDAKESVIDTFNATYTVEEILMQHGYDQRGDHFRHPASETGSYSASVRDGRVHSLSSADPLYTGGKGGGAHDAFSAFCVLKHGGEQIAAMKDAGDNLLFVEGGVSWNKAKRREYMRNKQLAEAVADMTPVEGEDAPPGPEPRSYEDILADAQAMSAETTPADIQRLAVECKDLEPVERRMVFMALKRRTGMPLGTLGDAMKSGDDGDNEPDHLQLATEVIRQVGPENIFEAQSFVWLWDGSGVWHKYEDRAVKQLVQNAIPSHTAEVYKSLVDGVADVLKNEVHRPSHEFNIGPVETVNCLNGEVSLNAASKWELHRHIREHYRTSQIPVSYDPDAKAPRFERFLTELFKGDPDADEKREAVLQMMGYTLMAHCRHEKFVVLVGGGANGKSVLLTVVEALVGAKNVAGVQPHQFDNVFQRGHLFCKLANIVSEIRQGEVINDAALKGIVSGELTTVEHKNKDPFEMRPFATCWFGTNHMPHTKDDSDGFFRRALVLTFNNVFKPELGNADPNLKDKLLEELPGILNLALQSYAFAVGCIGFITPSSSLKAAADWKQESDQVAQFFAEECEKRPGSSFTIANMYAAFRDWGEETGLRYICGKNTFTRRMELLGLEKKRNSEARTLTGLHCKRAVSMGFRPVDGSWGADD